MLFDNHSDEHLCVLLKQGDEKALEVIVLRYWEPMYKMAAHTLDDLFVCEDIVQDIFIKIWNNRQRLNFHHSLKAYLFACTRYEVYRQLKLRLVQDTQSTSEDFQYIEHYNPQNELEYNELLGRVEQLVNELPERCREVYQLSRDDQLTHKEIANLLDISTKTVENQLTIALRRLRNGISKTLFLLFL